MAQQKQEVIPYAFKHKPISVQELDELSKKFKESHKKDGKSLKTLNAAQLYLKKYWGFYLSKGKREDLMNEKIKEHYNSEAYSQCFMLYQLALTSREVLVKNKIGLPFGKNKDKPSDVELRALMPRQAKVIEPETPPQIGKGQIGALFASLQHHNNV